MRVAIAIKEGIIYSILIRKTKKKMEKLNLKFIGTILVWIGIAGAFIYFVPFEKIISSDQKIDSQKSEFVNAKLTAGHYEYDFGTIQIMGGKVRHSYNLKNEGPNALNVSKVWTSCMCTTAEIKTADGKIYGLFGMGGGHGGNTSANINIQPGEEFELIAKFDPMAHGPDAIGPIQRTVFIKTNADKEPLGLSFTADVVK